MKALITFQSKTGITKKYAREIADYLLSKKVQVQLVPVQEYTKEIQHDADLVFFGCWTSGLFLFLQHPDKVWTRFASAIPEMKSQKAILFTTYKLATGSMFRKMKECINGKVSSVLAELKSKDGKLSEADKKLLDSLIQTV
jgi:flavodoxin